MAKEYRINVKLEKWQYEELVRQMEKKGMKNRSEYIRYMITASRTDCNPEIVKLLKQHHYQLAKIGANVNQVVKSHNSYLYSQADKELLFQAMQLLDSDYQELLQLIRQIGEEQRK